MSSRSATPTSVVDVAGRAVAGVYTSVEREYAALRSSAVLVDRSERSRGAMRGAKAREVLAGLVTNDVVSLTPGTGQYAAALTPKGKIIADVRLFAHEEDVRFDVPPRAADGWWQMVRKYVNPRLARYADESHSTHDLSVYGVRSASIVAAALGIPPASLVAMTSYAHHPVDLVGEMVTVARVPDLSVDGFALWLAADVRDAAWDALVAAGAEPCGAEAFDVARIEAGRPEWGIDIDESTLAQEANMDELRAISYTKGCYTGQETVARVHFRGHVNRMLRGIRFDGPEPASKATLLDETGKTVGEVRSVKTSPRLGGIALAMVRREIEPPAPLSARWPEGETAVRLQALPFAAD